MMIRENVPLAPYTTLGVGGPARFFVEAADEGDVPEALEFARRRSVPAFVLGGGSNVVVADSGFPGLVLRIALKGVRRAGDGKVSGAAGEDWDGFVRFCTERNLAGVECLSGIPGTVGATPVQNVGAYGQEVGEVIESVKVLDRETFTIKEIPGSECGFGYRASLFNTSMRGRWIVLEVAFRLRPGGAPTLVYTDLQRRFPSASDHPSLAAVRKAVIEIRAGKSMVVRPDDPDSRSAGSFFKNPVLDRDLFQLSAETARRQGRLLEGEVLPGYRLQEDRVKVPAAWLIERAGFARGFRRGNVGLSARHALALVNRGGATAAEVLGLMREIQSAVREGFGIELASEPVFLGFSSPVRDPSTG